MTARSQSPRPQRSRLRVLGSLLLTVLVASAAVAGCVALYASSAPPRTLELRREELAAGVPKFIPLPSLGAAGTRTHGVWVTLQPDGSAVALSSRDPSGRCFIEWRAEASAPGGRGAFRDGCTGARFGPAGEPGGEPAGEQAAGPQPERGMDRYEVTRAAARLSIALDRVTLGNCGRGTQDCSRPGAPVTRRTY